MEVELSRNDNLTRLNVKGIIDEKGADELKTIFKQIDTAATKEVAIDCREVQHIGSSGIGKILLLYKHLATEGNRLSVINLPEDLFNLFKELKLDTLFHVSGKK